jgi:hypothetical protein
MSPARPTEPHHVPSDVELPTWTRQERREQVRRESDLSRTFDNWAARVLERGGKIAVAAVAIGGLFGMLLTSMAFLGVGFDGVPQKLARLEEAGAARDSLIAARVSRLENGAAATREDIRDIKNAATFQSQLLCYLIRTQDDRAAGPSFCSNVKAP